MTTPSREGFQTTDLHLSSYLIYIGCEYEVFKKETLKSGYPIGGWKFNDDIKRVQEAVVDYNEEKEVPLSPKKFGMTVARVRTELYDFLGLRKGKS